MSTDGKINIDNPLVSVIVPNYNHSIFLQERIESVLMQTYDRFEIIILDDASTDDSSRIIKQFSSHPKISNININDVNSGSPFIQWKKGIELSKGELIWIAESDDVAHPEFLEKMVNLLKTDPTISIAYSDSTVIDSDGNKKFDFRNNKIEWLDTDRWQKEYEVHGIEEVKLYLGYDCTINNTSAAVFRRDRILEANPFDISFRYIGDWYFFVKLLLNGKIHYLPESLNYYRIHENHCVINDQNRLVFLKEYFLFYDFLLRHYQFDDNRRITVAFKRYTRHYGIFNNNALRSLYRELWRVNKSLFLKMLFNNLVLNFKDKTGMVTHAN